MRSSSRRFWPYRPGKHSRKKFLSNYVWRKCPKNPKNLHFFFVEKMGYVKKKSVLSAENENSGL